jgi:HSP20 family molecular chaperone IbpA
MSDDDKDRRDIVERSNWPFDGFGLLDLDRMFRNMTRSMMKQPWSMDDDFRTPFSEIQEDKEKGEIVITLEMPGVSKEDIDVHVDEESITIEAEGESRKYRRSYSFGAQLDPVKTQASFTNGILEITLKKVKGRGKEGHKVKID